MTTLADRVHEVTTTTGTGTISLAGTSGAPGGAFRTFVAGVGNGAVVPYLIAHRTANEWEIGLGTVTDSTTDTLSRSRVISSSNSDAAVNFSSGVKDVALCYPATFLSAAYKLKQAVRVVATSNGTLASAFENGDTVDGVTLATGDRILLTGQSTASQNGIYTVAASGAPTRSVDLFTGSRAAGSIVVVTSGSSGAGKMYICTTSAGSDLVGTDSLTWTAISATASLDEDLTAIAALSSTGLIARTGSGTAAVRTLTASGAGLAITNGDGVSGNPTVALADLTAAIEALSGNGIICQTGSNTAAARTITAGSGISVTNGDGVSGNITIAATGGGSTREVLTSARTYYVRSDGNDSNTGLANNSGGAFLTIDRAINAVCDIDVGQYNVTIQLQDGTWALGSAQLGLKPITGAGRCIIQGNTGDASAVTISSSHADGTILANNLRCTYELRSLTLTSSASCLINVHGHVSIIRCAGVRFGSCTTQHLWIQYGALVDIIEACTITGGGQRHVLAEFHGRYYCRSAFTVSGTPAFSDAFAVARDMGLLGFAGSSFSGSATGKQFRVEDTAWLDRAGVTLPGDAAGERSPGPWYAITYASTITPNRENGVRHRCRLEGSPTLALPTNLTDGESLELMLIQDGTGSRTITASAYTWEGGSTPTLTATANKADILQVIRHGSLYLAKRTWTNVTGFIPTDPAVAPSIASYVTLYGGGTVSITKPTGTTSGDLLVLVLLGRNSGFSTKAVPSGFTTLDRPSGNFMQVAWKAAGGSEPSSYSQDVPWSAALIRISTANITTPIVAQTPGTNGSGAYTSMSTAVNSLALLISGRSDGTALTDPGAGWTVAFDDLLSDGDGGDTRLQVASRQYATATTTGTPTSAGTGGNITTMGYVIAGAP